MKWRKIFFISIIVICIVSINLAVYMQITQKEKKSIKKSDIEPVVVDTVELTENFEHIFDNKIDYCEVFKLTFDNEKLIDIKNIK